MADPEKPLPSLAELQNKIDQAKVPSGDEEAASSSSDMRQGMRLGVELVAGVAVGSTAGYFLDRWLGTMPLFFIICFFLGVAAGFKNLLRGIAENDETK